MPALENLRDTVKRELAARRADETLTAPPAARIAVAGVVAIVASVLAAYLLAIAGKALFTVPAAFDKLGFQGYAALTVVGVVGATIAWALVSRYAPRPQKLLAQLAVLVTIVLLLPDFWLLTQAGNPVGPVMTLIAMHIAIGVAAFVLLLAIAPVRRNVVRSTFTAGSPVKQSRVSAGAANLPA